MTDDRFLSPQERIDRELEQEFHKQAPAGELIGQDIPQSEYMGLNAGQLKDLRTRLPGLTDAELERIPVEPEGYRLRAGSTYVNLRDPSLTPFVAIGGMIAEPGSALAPKTATDYLLWNRIVGVESPEQLDEPPGTPLP
ncbi:MAG TPA: hypothetical protein VIC27_05520 [Ktedonobacterales bacterium]|jgi:hypothetical protein